MMNTFELTEALINDLLFSMEDQEGEFYMDTQDAMIVESANLEDNRNRYINLPDWDSSDGFRLMERFTVGVRNPLVREELSTALNRGKGVFRAFKNVLHAYPTIEKRWFSFKEREMKREVIRWYNALRDEWGMERIGTEPEETDDLILEDFIFRPVQEKDIAEAAFLHRLCLEEYQANGKRPFPQAERNIAECIVFIAETGSGDFAAYISAARDQNNEIFYITALEVKAEYRSLGIGEELLSRFIEKFAPHDAAMLSIDLPVEYEGFSRVLLRNNFKPYAIRYYSNLVPEAKM
ncbi:MAG: GNAT family N-acetyltransferase [Treponema sp.]|jgi:ribosomal protein S18 acetylase RimI-like enzyme|nr:GNAT family N-acetyltransferase [Treponema sp.]